MKKIFVLTNDFWHHTESIMPLLTQLFDDTYEVIVSERPEDLSNVKPDLFLTFKDPIENDQIPTPVWCTGEWMKDFLFKVENGMGVLCMHAALTDLPLDHEMITAIVRSSFLYHPAPCEVSFVPVKTHPVLEGVSEFTFPTGEEHYQMEMLPDYETEVIAETKSENGVRPGAWVHTYKKGRICCITPAHTKESLSCDSFVKMMKNAVLWCLNA